MLMCANAHDVFARSWSLNSCMLRIAGAEIASKRGQCLFCTIAKDHAMLVRPLLPISDILFMAAAAIAESRGSVHTLKRANAQRVLHKSCGVACQVFRGGGATNASAARKPWALHFSILRATLAMFCVPDTDVSFGAATKTHNIDGPLWCCIVVHNRPRFATACASTTSTRRAAAAQSAPVECGPSSCSLAEPCDLLVGS
mmetsp:Transcript_139829/g.446142  ORF Transcript_139829/g.446142 Transcript_139829/m.446142 type:complete len:200 (-) Transcript_139829:1141-1740(-)